MAVQNLLVAINAKYAHTNLAVRCLQNALEEKGISAAIAEYTINQPNRDILTAIVARHPQRLLFSCYLWNIETVRAVGAEFRLLYPQTPILLGGPEVSFDPEEQLAGMPWADAILCGEGESLLPKVLSEARPRGVYRGDGCVRLDELPFPYGDLAALKGRVLYYESSRGCPFGCAYCLSSADTTVRYRSLGKVYEDLRRFLDAGVMKVKFVDRTFNLNPERAAAIWRYLIEHDNGVTGFQMELGGDLLTPEQLALLKGARRGLFQFEIGVQSTHGETLRQVARRTDLDKLKANVRAIQSAGNIHQHLDLIAGLPGESFEAFRQSYNDVYALRPEQLQLGFLKLLRGSALYGRRQALGLVHSPNPPYEILQTPDITFEALARLKIVEAMTELYYNSGRFTRELEAVTARCESPFDALLALGESMPERNVGQYEAFDRLYAFGVSRGCDPERLAWLMRLDICLHERPKKLPAHCAKGEPVSRQATPSHGKEDPDRLTERFPAYAVGLEGHEWATVAFDYSRRDAWGRAGMEWEL